MKLINSWESPWQPKWFSKQLERSDVVRHVPIETGPQAWIDEGFLRAGGYQRFSKKEITPKPSEMKKTITGSDIKRNFDLFKRQGRWTPPQLRSEMEPGSKIDTKSFIFSKNYLKTKANIKSNTLKNQIKRENLRTSIGKLKNRLNPQIKTRAAKALKKGGPFLGNVVKGVAWDGPRKLKNLAKALPAPIKKAGLFGTVLLGATAMFGIGMMKGAMNQSRDIVYERYMQDQAVGKNMLNNTRLGLSAGTSRMQTYGHTTGLSNSLSRTRHG